MSLLIKNGNVYVSGKIKPMDVLVDDHGLVTVADQIDLEEAVDEVIDAAEMLIAPGLIDPHVHLREPGFEYKETIKSGAFSAAKGGYTTIFSMPNLNPVPDTVEHIQKQLDLIKQQACIRVIPYASITQGQKGWGELVDMEALSEYVLGFSDDGKGVQSEALMRNAMLEAKKHNCIIVAHCEDESIIDAGACIHQGKKAAELGLIGISSESEYKQIERDLRLAKETGCQYHICHVSCKESVDLIRQAKKEGVDVSAEVTVHHLLLCEEDITRDDGNFKMNPPLRSKEDQQALLEGVLDGTLQMIATDHAPHSEEEKSKGLQGSAMGIIGSELAFGLVYHYLVMQRKLPLEKVLDCMSYNCANLFGIEGGEIVNFEKANLAIFDLKARKRIEKKDIVSKGKNTPFYGWYMSGICRMTLCDGEIVYREGI